MCFFTFSTTFCYKCTKLMARWKFIVLSISVAIKVYLFINYNTITDYILIIYELSNFNHVVGVAAQTRVLWVEIESTTLMLIVYHTTH